MPRTASPNPNPRVGLAQAQAEERPEARLQGRQRLRPDDQKFPPEFSGLEHAAPTRRKRKPQPAPEMFAPEDPRRSAEAVHPPALALPATLPAASKISLPAVKLPNFGRLREAFAEVHSQLSGCRYSARRRASGHDAARPGTGRRPASLSLTERFPTLLFMRQPRRSILFA